MENPKVIEDHSDDEEEVIFKYFVYKTKLLYERDPTTKFIFLLDFSNNNECTHLMNFYVQEYLIFLRRLSLQSTIYICYYFPDKTTLTTIVVNPEDCKTPTEVTEKINEFENETCDQYCENTIFDDLEKLMIKFVESNKIEGIEKALMLILRNQQNDEEKERKLRDFKKNWKTDVAIVKLKSTGFSGLKEMRHLFSKAEEVYPAKVILEYISATSVQYKVEETFFRPFKIFYWVKDKQQDSKKMSISITLPANFILENLEPDTEYCVSIGSEKSQESFPLSFKTKSKRDRIPTFDAENIQDAVKKVDLQIKNYKSDDLNMKKQLNLLCGMKACIFFHGLRESGKTSLMRSLASIFEGKFNDCHRSKDKCKIPVLSSFIDFYDIFYDSSEETKSDFGAILTEFQKIFINSSNTLPFAEKNTKVEEVCNGGFILTISALDVMDSKQINKFKTILESIKNQPFIIFMTFADALLNNNNQPFDSQRLFNDTIIGHYTYNLIERLKPQFDIPLNKIIPIANYTTLTDNRDYFVELAILEGLDQLLSSISSRIKPNYFKVNIKSSIDGDSLGEIVMKSADITCLEFRKKFLSNKRFDSYNFSDLDRKEEGETRLFFKLDNSKSPALELKMTPV